MKIRRLDKSGDWTFGQSLANYSEGDEAIVQNAVTRVKEFRNDWLWNINTGADWFNILSQKNNEDIIKREVARLLLASEGVSMINNLSIASKENEFQIRVTITTIYNRNFLAHIGINDNEDN